MMQAVRKVETISHTIEMSVSEWIKIPDNPRQRDTERHLIRAKHLRIPSPVHARVAMAVGADGKKWKLDGHTRAVGWQRKMFQVPESLVVSVFPVVDEREACELYSQFDAQEAVEGGTDKMFGAYRALGFSPKSALLRRGMVTSALRLAEGCARGARFPDKAPIYDLANLWLPEIKTLDVLNPVRVRFAGPLIAAALMTFRRYGPAALEFWQLYNDDAGQKYENAMDPVEALSRFIMQSKPGGAAKVAAAGTYDVIGKGLAAFEAHKTSRTYTRSFLGIDPTRYISVR